MTSAPALARSLLLVLGRAFVTNGRMLGLPMYPPVLAPRSQVPRRDAGRHPGR